LPLPLGKSFENPLSGFSGEKRSLTPRDKSPVLSNPSSFDRLLRPSENSETTESDGAGGKAGCIKRLEFSEQIFRQ
jgi:hypothetical protein